MDGKHLRELRYRAGLTQAQVAKVLGVPQQFVSQFERGIRPFPEKHTEKLVMLDPSLGDEGEPETEERRKAKKVGAPRGPYWTEPSDGND